LVFGNETLLFSAIKNIASNACKYSPDGMAFVQLSAAQNEVVISIADNGAGIPHADLPHIFQPFYRADNTRQEGGFGLGLSLAARIIKIHKGHISVTSEPGKQTVFTVTLPAAAQLKTV
jgi:two-component system, OmpR family, sensor histidine kinase ArlS